MIPWTEAYQAPPSMGFSRLKYWSGLPFPSPGDLPDPGTEPVSLLSSSLEGGVFTTSITYEAHSLGYIDLNKKIIINDNYLAAYFYFF